MNNFKKIVRESIKDVISESYTLGKLNKQMSDSFFTPHPPYTRKDKGPYTDFEPISASELTGDSVRMKCKRLPKEYDGKCYVVLLDDMLSFSELGKFNPNGENIKHYFVVKCNNPEEAKIIIKNARKDYMRLLGIDTEMPQFGDEVSYNVKNFKECLAWHDDN